MTSSLLRADVSPALTSTFSESSNFYSSLGFITAIEASDNSTIAIGCLSKVSFDLDYLTPFLSLFFFPVLPILFSPASWFRTDILTKLGCMLRFIGAAEILTRLLSSSDRSVFVIVSPRMSRVAGIATVGALLLCSVSGTVE